MNDGEALRCRDELMAAVDTILAKEVRISAIRALAYEPLYRNVYWVANKSFEISKFKFNISESSNLRTSQGSFSAVSKPNFASKYSFTERVFD